MEASMAASAAVEEASITRNTKKSIVSSTNCVRSSLAAGGGTSGRGSLILPRQATTTSTVSPSHGIVCPVRMAAACHALVAAATHAAQPGAHQHEELRHAPQHLRVLQVRVARQLARKEQGEVLLRWPWQHPSMCVSDGTAARAPGS